MFSVSERKIDRTLVGLAVACLFLCHGALGSLHLFSGPLAHSALPGEHIVRHAPTEGSGGTGNGDHTEQHRVGAEYFAVLLGFLIGGIVCLLDKARRWYAAPVLQLVGRLQPTLVSNLPRGPTAPLLQVFRL